MIAANFQFLSALLKRRSGLVIAADKTYLVESRLNPIARRLGHANLDAMTDVLRAGKSPALESAVIEAMTTNESSFFRDKTPFERLRTSVLPRLLAARADTKRLSIWCAACSSGQEPYSIAILLKEMEGQLRGWRIDILGTDISSAVLEKAKAGLYTQFEVQRGLSIQRLVRYFAQEGESWRLDGSIRAMVQFRQFNLLDEFESLGQFDIVLCRNVLIYFDRDTKADVLNRLSRVLAGDGFLALGAAETLVGLSDALRPVSGERSFYAAAAPVAAAKAAAVG